MHRIRRMAREQQRKKQEKAASLDWTLLHSQTKKSRFNDKVNNHSRLGTVDEKIGELWNDIVDYQNY